MSEKEIGEQIREHFKNNDLRQLLELRQQCLSSPKLQKLFINTLFFSTQSLVTKDTIKTIFKRYLNFITQVLKIESKSPSYAPYTSILSQQLPEQFVFFLKQCIQHAMDFLLDLKVFRRRWAKRISDQAYFKIHQLALKNLKFDMDKGIPQQTANQIRSGYEKRRFSQAEIAKYMPSANGEHRPKVEPQKREIDHSSSDDYGSQKKVKRDRRGNRMEERYPDQYSDSMNRHSSLNPSSLSNGNRFPQSSQGYPPRSYHPDYFVQEQPYPNPYYPPQPYKNHNQPPYQQPYQPYGQQYHQQDFYQKQPAGYGYAPTQNHQQQIDYQYSNGNFYGQSTNKAPRKSTHLSNNIDQLRLKLKQGKDYECRFCGLMLLTNEKYEKHMTLHFNEAQKQYEASHSRRDHARKSLMPTSEQWLQSRKSKQRQSIRLFVTIKGASSEMKARCMACHGQLKVSWWPEMDSWVFMGAVRGRSEGETEICHEECYKALSASD